MLIYWMVMLNLSRVLRMVFFFVMMTPTGQSLYFDEVGCPKFPFY